jgi:hypothetical protein
MAASRSLRRSLSVYVGMGGGAEVCEEVEEQQEVVVF